MTTVTAELDKEMQLFSANLQHWLNLPMVEKICGIVRAVTSSEGKPAEIYAQMKSAMKYPFTTDDNIVGGHGVCLHEGRLKSKDNKVVYWHIWKSEHAVTFSIF